jgi:ribosome-associated protein
VTPGVAIPADEIEVSVSRGGGPGGQHVNKVSTRVALVLDVLGSPSLPADAKARIRERLASRLTADGRLRVVCGVHRSQSANRREALKRLAEILRRALAPRRKRLPTGVPHAERERRLSNKRARARTKDQRRARGAEE